MTFSEDVRAAFRRGENERVAQLSRAEIVRARAENDDPAQVEALYMLSRTRIRSGHLLAAESTASDALAVAIRTGDRSLEERPRHVLAAVARMTGDLPLARERYLQSIELNMQLNQAKNVTSERHNLSLTELHLGHLVAARELIAQVREEVFRAGYDDFVPYVCVAATVLAAAEQDYLMVARLLGLTVGAFVALGQVPDPDDAAELDAARQQAKAAISEQVFAEEYHRGHQLNPADVLTSDKP